MPTQTALKLYLEPKRPHAICRRAVPKKLAKLAQAHLISSQAELADAFHVKTGITAHPDTFAKRLEADGDHTHESALKGFYYLDRAATVVVRRTC